MMICGNKRVGRFFYERKNRKTNLQEPVIYWKTEVNRDILKIFIRWLLPLSSFLAGDLSPKVVQAKSKVAQVSGVGVG